MTTKPENLRERWKNFSRQLPWEQEVIDKLEDFWLKRFSSHQSKLVEQIEGMKKVSDITKNGGSKANWRNTVGYNKGLSDAVAIIKDGV